MNVISGIPLIPVRDTVLFPDTEVALAIGRPRSIAALQKSIGESDQVFLISQKDPEEESPSYEHLNKIGTVCRILKVVGNEKSGYQVHVRSELRAKLQSVEEQEDLLLATVEEFPDEISDELELQAIADNLKVLAVEVLKMLPGQTGPLIRAVRSLESPLEIIHLCAEQIPLSPADKYQLLSEPSAARRGEDLYELLVVFRNNLRVQVDVNNRLSAKMSKQQRDAILREQLKAIQEELGESSESSDDLGEKIKSANLPDEVRKVVDKEYSRLQSMSENSAEAGIIKNYLDLIVTLPWNSPLPDVISIEAAEKALNTRHSGLKKIKKRILQHMAVMQMSGGKKGTILLFVGPPGVGKTSLGESIAEAMGRKFVRIALGGVRDESEVRGHRRTYIGAMPGRIIQGIKRAGTSNPVVMLDEIDKMSASLQGDPTAALLEVLDPEQNHTFTDHYLDLPYDLSQVVFIATANTLDTIPSPLRDRMEIIQLSGYTTNEKVEIANRYLVARQIADHGLSDLDIEINEDSLRYIIEKYTREAGVRSLNRKLAEVCRHLAEAHMRKPLEGKTSVVQSEIRKWLGKELFKQEEARTMHLAGVVTGLAWTPVGGEILYVESRAMPGSGKLTLTGQLGEVMRESAQIAMSLLRANLVSVVPNVDFAKMDYHIHVPQGAIPKDGPSAGVAMLTALASLALNIRLDPTLAMTGEITLRGDVTPVGGIKEKVIAAHRSGMQIVLIPEENEKDLDDIPEDIKADLDIRLVSNVDDVLRIAFGLDPKWPGQLLASGNHDEQSIVADL